MSDIADNFSQAWVNKMPFLSDVFPRQDFLLLFWNLHFAQVKREGKFKKEKLIKSILDKIISNQIILCYLPSATVAVDESTVSLKRSVFRNMPSHDASKVWTENICIV
jgi:hypothetical protein